MLSFIIAAGNAMNTLQFLIPLYINFIEMYVHVINYIEIYFYSMPKSSHSSGVAEGRPVPNQLPEIEFIQIYV